MRSLLVVSAALGLTLFGGIRVRAADDDVKAVIQKAIKAHGGEEAFAKWQKGQTKVKGNIDFMGNELPIVQEVTYQLPDQFRQVLEVDAAGQKINIISAFDGKKAWTEVAGKLQDLDAKTLDELKESVHLMRVTQLTDLLKDKAFKLAPIGEAKVEGKPAVGVRVAFKGFRDMSLYFDKGSGLLVKAERRALDPNGQEVTEERIYKDYQKIDGMQLPKKVTMNHDNKKFLDAEMVEAKALEKVDPNLFKAPNP